MDIGTAFSDPKVLQPFFAGTSWDGWRAVLRAAFGERMNEGGEGVLSQCGEQRAAAAKGQRALGHCWETLWQGFGRKRSCDAYRGQL